ncbi:DNA sulfur modification protein DndB [Sphingomonas sp. ZB1N12]|uniref:DNA sulfur modification protein DndB n=1 Tax=Sphingomonas arabinosi TaxID=3096160 RepID=UPI002FCA7696
MDPAFEYAFPAIRGVQAKRQFYVSMCPLRLIPRLFLFNEAEMVPELRAQRQLNKQRLPEIARYIAENRDSYVFSAITASVDADVRFDPHEGSTDLGVLHVPMDARFIINDGQHRRAAIEMALAQCPDLGDESISVVFFMDRGLERCQQMFADLNRYAIRPSTSLNVLYDQRDRKAQLAKLVVERLPGMKPLVNLERSNLAKGSKHLLTLSALFTATNTLLDNHELGDEEEEVVVSFWSAVLGELDGWRDVGEGRMTAGTFRETNLHGQAVVLDALGRVGNSLLGDPRPWPEKLKGLGEIRWRRDDPQWEGRAMIGGVVNKGRQSVIMTAAVIKSRLGLPLGADERRAEHALNRGDLVA